MSDNIPAPGIPQITASVVKAHGVRVSWKIVPGASEYLLQVSKDDGLSWATVQDQIKIPVATISGLTNGIKVHLRIMAKGHGGISEPSDEYPVYMTEKVPPPPDGLMLYIDRAHIYITWGNILGAGHYQLYRRKKMSQQKQCLSEYTPAATSGIWIKNHPEELFMNTR